MLKVELHIHTGDDPVDLIPHSTAAVIDRAADLGYDAIAITLHERQLDLAPHYAHAARRGLVLIPGVERTIAGKHVLLLNFPAVADRVETFEEVTALKARCRGVVIAPHPFYPFASCLGRQLTSHASVFDAVEYNAFYTSRINAFNELAVRWAKEHGKPLVANTDVHRLSQLGSTYSLVEAERDPASICDAVRAGRVELRSAPMPTPQAVTYFADLMAAHVRARVRAARGARHLTAAPSYQE
jgi:predicted metal-dependent phosphoesterase TrpH